MLEFYGKPALRYEQLVLIGHISRNVMKVQHKLWEALFQQINQPHNDSKCS